jgi:predicted patatin/cPLA2 family phospholipase
VKPVFNVLSLDGGGSKGVFSIGVLKELAAVVQVPLHEFFDLIYGTSTGAIIAAAIATGMSPDEVDVLYMRLIPYIMKRFTRRGRSAALRECLEDTFTGQTFSDCKSMLGIVSTDRDRKKPVVFKTNPGLAEGLQSTFVPGFGCTIATAAEASCSAYPFFKCKRVQTQNQGELNLIDGGFSANNPTLLAYGDALKASAGRPIQILSVGVGQYPERTPWRGGASAGWIILTKDLIETQFAASAACLATSAEFTIPGNRHKVIRVHDEFSDRNLATNLLDYDTERLGRIRGKGRDAFAKREAEIRAFVNASNPAAIPV